MQIIYRKIKNDEAQDFRRIRFECLKTFPEKFGSTCEDEAEMPKLFFEEIIEKDLADSFFFGAFADNNLLGIAGFIRGNRTKTQHRGELVAMYVDPDYHGQKIGEDMLRELLNAVFEINGIESIELTVVADNLAASKLYEKIGFETFGIQKNYFKDGEKYWNQRFMQLTKERFLERNSDK